MKAPVFCSLLVANLVLVQPAQARAFCSGTISKSTVYASGAVTVIASWRNATTQVCNLKIEWKNITPDVCAAWLARIDAAVTLQRPVTFYYSEDLDCGTMATYVGSPPPDYIQLQ